MFYTCTYVYNNVYPYKHICISIVIYMCACVYTYISLSLKSL